MINLTKLVWDSVALAGLTLEHLSDVLAIGGAEAVDFVEWDAVD